MLDESERKIVLFQNNTDRRPNRREKRGKQTPFTYIK